MGQQPGVVLTSGQGQGATRRPAIPAAPATSCREGEECKKKTLPARLPPAHTLCSALHSCPPYPVLAPPPARILGISGANSPNPKLTVCWYYRPEDKAITGGRKVGGYCSCGTAWVLVLPAKDELATPRGVGGAGMGWERGAAARVAWPSKGVQGAVRGCSTMPQGTVRHNPLHHTQPHPHPTPTPPAQSCTHRPAQSFHGERELYASDHIDEIAAATVLSKCTVHTIEDYQASARASVIVIVRSELTGKLPGKSTCICDFVHSEPTGKFTRQVHMHSRAACLVAAACRTRLG